MKRQDGIFRFRYDIERAHRSEFVCMSGNAFILDGGHPGRVFRIENVDVNKGTPTNGGRLGLLKTWLENNVVERVCKHRVTDNLLDGHHFKDGVDRPKGSVFTQKDTVQLHVCRWWLLMGSVVYEPEVVAGKGVVEGRNTVVTMADPVFGEIKISGTNNNPDFIPWLSSQAVQADASRLDMLKKQGGLKEDVEYLQNKITKGMGVPPFSSEEYRPVTGHWDAEKWSPESPLTAHKVGGTSALLEQLQKLSHFRAHVGHARAVIRSADDEWAVFLSFDDRYIKMAIDGNEISLDYAPGKTEFYVLEGPDILMILWEREKLFTGFHIGKLYHGDDGIYLMHTGEVSKLAGMSPKELRQVTWRPGVSLDTPPKQRSWVAPHGVASEVHTMEAWGRMFVDANGNPTKPPSADTDRLLRFFGAEDIGSAFVLVYPNAFVFIRRSPIGNGSPWHYHIEHRISEF